jgi:hypothetical protein
MFFILLYGWDGLGYDRFLYDRDMLPGSPAWTPGVALLSAGGALPALWHFLSSSVAKTLYIDGIYLLPPFFWLTSRWRREAAAGDHTPLPAVAVRVTTYLGGALVVGLGGAALCALLVRGVAYLLGIHDQVARGLGQAPAATGAHLLSYLIGLPLGLALLWISVLRPRGPVQRLLSPIILPS